MENKVYYIDKHGKEQIGEFVEIDNHTIIYKDVNGVEIATANWAEKQ